MTPIADGGTATVSVNAAGMIRSINLAFTDVFGFSSAEVSGKPFRNLLTAESAAALGDLFDRVANSGESVERSLEARHKKGAVLPVSVTVAAERTGQPGCMLTITPLNDSVGIITIDLSGQIKTTNTFVTRIFGHSQEELATMNVAQLMPRPYSRFHANYLSNYRTTGVAKVVGDPRGRVVTGMHKDGRSFEMRLEVHEMKDEALEGARGVADRMFIGRITLDSSTVADRRCMKLKLSEEGDVLSVSGAGEDLFGLSASACAGKTVEEVLRFGDGSADRLLACLAALPPHARGNKKKPAPVGRAPLSVDDVQILLDRVSGEREAETVPLGAWLAAPQGAEWAERLMRQRVYVDTAALILEAVRVAPQPL